MKMENKQTHETHGHARTHRRAHKNECMYLHSFPPAIEGIWSLIITEELKSIKQTNWDADLSAPLTWTYFVVKPSKGSRLRTRPMGLLACLGLSPEICFYRDTTKKRVGDQAEKGVSQRPVLTLSKKTSPAPRTLPGFKGRQVGKAPTVAGPHLRPARGWKPCFSDARWGRKRPK